MKKRTLERSLIKLIAFLVPFFQEFSTFITKPITLLLIAGIWAAMGLPIVNIGAIYLSNNFKKNYSQAYY